MLVGSSLCFLNLRAYFVNVVSEVQNFNSVHPHLPWSINFGVIEVHVSPAWNILIVNASIKVRFCVDRTRPGTRYYILSLYLLMRVTLKIDVKTRYRC